MNMIILVCIVFDFVCCYLVGKVVVVIDVFVCVMDFKLVDVEMFVECYWGSCGI